ncbi:uncharacterized protein LOC126373395 [Pectinophora gossypiella]|uniref:uncharacterized protein LOC126373395 n=1 Tax=Pectinophora gossypiella TaxID=13191 RepID=UPI00214EEBBE|nr:uncharacterized protein LOC126373395 [Pectinophora gossypiella]
MMLKSLAFVFCLALVGQYADGAQSVQKDEKPDVLKNYPGCYVSYLGRVLAFGVRAPDESGVCREYICPTDSSDEAYHIVTCPNYSEECILIPGDSDALYPDCCDKLDSEKTIASGAQCYATS